MKKKQNNNLPFYYWDELYKMNYYFHLGWNEFKFVEYARENYNYHRDRPLGDGLCLEIEHKDGSVGYVIWTRFKNDNFSLVHELAHAALFVFQRSGIPVYGDNSEAFCYYQEHLFRKVIELKKGK